MKTCAPKNDRRQGPRFKVLCMVVAVSGLPSCPPGNVKEISQSGLVLQYRGNGTGEMVPRELDIIWADYVATHHLEKIPVRIVWDTVLTKEEESNESIIRRQAIAFEKLTPLQENQIGRLIHTQGALAQ